MMNFKMNGYVVLDVVTGCMQTVLLLKTLLLCVYVVQLPHKMTVSDIIFFCPVILLHS